MAESAFGVEDYRISKASKKKIAGLIAAGAGVAGAQVAANEALRRHANKAGAGVSVGDQYVHAFSSRSKQRAAIRRAAAEKASGHRSARLNASADRADRWANRQRAVGL